MVGLAPNGSTAANIVKAVAGAAVFAMPYVFLDMGIVGAVIVISVLTGQSAAPALHPAPCTLPLHGAVLAVQMAVRS